MGSHRSLCHLARRDVTDAPGIAEWRRARIRLTTSARGIVRANGCSCECFIPKFHVVLVSRDKSFVLMFLRSFGSLLRRLAFSFVVFHGLLWSRKTTNRITDPHIFEATRDARSKRMTALIVRVSYSDSASRVSNGRGYVDNV